MKLLYERTMNMQECRVKIDNGCYCVRESSLLYLSGIAWGEFNGFLIKKMANVSTYKLPEFTNTL